MSLSPARTKHLNPISLNPYPTLLEFYASINREWELLAKDVDGGMMKGITLLPSKNSATEWIDKVSATLKHLNHHNNNNNNNHHHSNRGGSSVSGRSTSPNFSNDSSNNSNRRRRPHHSTTSQPGLPKSFFGFELFLLGGDTDSDDSEDGKSTTSSSSNSASPQIAGQLTSNLLRTIATTHPLIFNGFMTVNSKMSPWYGGCFEFQIQIFLGYPDHSCPAVCFTSPLSHPELRDGRHLPVISELFASTRRVKNPFMLRDILDAIRELFVQPVPMFRNEVVQRAALDVKFRSVTSAYFNREDLLDLDTFVLQENLHILNQATNGGAMAEMAAVAAANATNTSNGNGLISSTSIISNANPATRFLAQQEREAERRNRQVTSSSSSSHHQSNEFDDVLEDTKEDLSPYFLHTDLGVILTEAHLPYVMQRYAEKDYPENDNNKNQDQTPKVVAASTTMTREKSLEEQSKRATKWIGRTTSNANGKPIKQANFDKWMNCRLMRQFIPQVSNVADF